MSRRSFQHLFSGCRTPQCCHMTEVSPYAKSNTLMFAFIFWMKTASCREVSSGSSGGGGGGLSLCTDKRTFPYPISSDMASQWHEASVSEQTCGLSHVMDWR